MIEYMFNLLLHIRAMIWTMVIGGKHISPYDDLLKKHAHRIGWDWRMIASIMYEESGFDPQAESWVGAKGLLQLMPPTAKQMLGKDSVNLFNPALNIYAGTEYLKYLNRYWKKSVPDSTDRIKFILASYNIGIGHVEDARRLSWKYSRDSVRWDDNVEYYLLKKHESTYAQDPVTKSGFCRGNVTIEYVNNIIHRFHEYKTHIKD